MRKIKNNLINEMKQMLDNKKSLTVESLIFNEAEDDYGMENEYDEKQNCQVAGSISDASGFFCLYCSQCGTGGGTGDRKRYNQ